MIHRMRAWATARRQAREEEALSKLRESLDELGLSQPIPESVEGALRQTARSEWVTVSLSILSLLATWIWIGWMFAFTWQVGREVASFGDGISVPAWGKVVDAVDRTEPFKVGMLIPMFGGAIAVSIGILIAIPVGLFVFSRMIGGTPSRVARAMGMEVTYLPFAAALAVRNMVEIANSCAEAGRASGEARVQSVAGIPAASASSKRAIMRASRHRAFWWPFSHHGAVLREHAALVLGRIQQAEERLYRDPQPALRELALMWLTVSERYVDGRLGQLLDQDLSSVEPAKSRLRSALRAGLAVVLTVGAVFFTASLDLPQAIEGYVIAGSAVAVLLLVYGARAIVELRRR